MPKWYLIWRFPRSIMQILCLLRMVFIDLICETFSYYLTAFRCFWCVDESPGSVARIPRSYASKSPPPSFYASKGLIFYLLYLSKQKYHAEWFNLILSTEETNKKKVVVEENQKNVRATSAPRPRAVLSSPGNSHSPTLCRLDQINLDKFRVTVISVDSNMFSFICFACIYICIHKNWYSITIVVA